MTDAAKTVYYFGWYLVCLGIILLGQPNSLLTLFGIASTSEVWIRVVGLLALALSAYYLTAGKKNIVPILKTTVYVRSSIILFFTGFVVAGLVSPTLILFGAVDLAGAVWTYPALKKEGLF